MGSPPRGRGKGSYRADPGDQRGDHPRVGGEKAFFSGKFDETKGSPPRGRGKAKTVVLNCPSVRITPAWAGKSRTFQVPADSCGDHPREGGEKAQDFLLSHKVKGSPPHRRGKASLCSGMNLVLRDHPRTGGEKNTRQKSGGKVTGSPPHRRGKARDSRKRDSGEGITPAWAGKSVFQLYLIFVVEDHPRMGGEKPNQASHKTVTAGSPPHRRGKAEFKKGMDDSQRITPA